MLISESVFNKCVIDLFKTLKLQLLDDEIKSFENKLQQDAAGKFEGFFKLIAIDIGGGSKAEFKDTDKFEIWMSLVQAPQCQLSLAPQLCFVNS